MVDETVITAKLVELKDRIERVRRHRTDDASALASDRDALDLVSFNLMLAVQACVDIAGHLIADARWAPAKDLGEAFQRLREHHVLDRQTADALTRAAGLRNVVAHVYAQADPELILRAATSGLEELERFAQQVARWVRAQSSRSGS